ncbi:glycosyltransferase family 4 protein [Flectobacillus sp. BAB-3569]|uniref:glycosyltransferase family 4 protein n=1 Tax=Flectobacillus sp. BAB-3569 TaxID=1509483 RepID=UPI000BA4C494|nr:glycosyltransferase family 4 protein [Flectobacillus sp. BAB-3569]PAC30626.1 hypothetical protein BWI92_11360 [Flectobacillus sp. BAB-3569]
MNIVVHDYGGYPFIYDLSLGLSEQNHNVIHIFSSASGSPNGVFPSNQNLRIIDLGELNKKVNKSNFFKRFIQEYQYGRKLVKTLGHFSSDIVLSANTPLLAQIQLAFFCKRKNIRFLFWLQDLLSIAAKNVIKEKIPILGNIIGALFFQIERKALLLSNHCIIISEEFKEFVLKCGVDNNNITVIHNWSQIDSISITPKRNSFAEEYNIQKTFNLVYTGTLGMKQNPDILLKIAKSYKHDNNFKLIVIANGIGNTYLKKYCKDNNLDNIICLPLQPYEKLSEILGCADLLIATLTSASSEYCVPSKILTYFCSGKCTLLIMPQSNPAAKLVSSNNLGFVVSPDDFDSIKSQIDYCLENPQVLFDKGQNARKYAEDNFNKRTIVKLFLEVI